MRLHSVTSRSVCGAASGIYLGRYPVRISIILPAILTIVCDLRMHQANARIIRGGPKVHEQIEDVIKKSQCMTKICDLFC